MIAETIENCLEAISALQCTRAPDAMPSVEIVVVDNSSEDRTVEEVGRYGGDIVRLARCEGLGAARARNRGAAISLGRLLVFMDADTRMPREALLRIESHYAEGFQGGICRLDSLEGGWRAWLWWAFWSNVRRLPLARAKAMPAFMFCSREVFESFGPFDEGVAIGEEWPILAGLYARRRKAFIYDCGMRALSSNRRMEMQTCGYLANLAKYVWAILHRSGRIRYADRYRRPLEKRDS